MQRKDLFFIDYYHLKTKTACPEGQAVFVVGTLGMSIS